MSDAASIRSVRTNATSYVPLEKTATRVVEELKNAQDKSPIYQQIFMNDDTGNILSHLFTNPQTRKDAWVFFDSNEEWCIQQMDHFSDPQFIALGYLCKKRPERVPEILRRICPVLKTKSTPLAVLARIDISLVDLAYLPSILQYLASESYMDLSLAVVVLAKMIHEKRPEVIAAIKSEFKTPDSPGQAASQFRILGHLFSIDQSLAADIYGSQADLDPSYWSKKEVTVACLEMLNSACIVKELRGSVAKYPILDTAKDSHDKDIKTMAAVVFAKLIASGTLTENPSELLSNLDGYSVLFENYILDNIQTASTATISRTSLLFSVVEAFAVTSSLSSVRLRADLSLMQCLATIVRSNDAPWVYGALCSFANLVEYPFKPTAEQRRIEELKRQTGAQAAFDVDSKLDPSQTIGIAEKVFDTGVLNYLSASAGKLSLKSREQVTRILQSISGHQQQSLRKKLAQQGGVIIAVYLWVDDKTVLDDTFKSVSASVVSKVITSVDPRDTFTHKFTPVAVVDPLASQLGNAASERPNLDTLEALMALTNLASIENDKLNDLIVSKCWTKIETAMSTEFIQVQRAIFQLICNLCYCEAAAGKFTDKTKHGEFLRDTLGHALMIEDLDAKLAAAGAIAILCEHPEMPTLFGHNPTVMENLIKSLETENEDLLLRVMTALHDTMVKSLKRNDDEAIEDVIYFGGVPRIEAVVDRIDPHNIPLAGIVARTIKLLVHFKLKEKLA